MHGKPLIYFDSAATAQKPQCVIDSLKDFYQQHYGTVHRAIYELSVNATTAYEEVRKKVKAFLNAAHSKEIIFTRGTTDAINLVASSFGKAFVHPGDEILITEMEHHSNIVPWQIMCQERNANLKVVPMTDSGELDVKVLSTFLSEKTKILAVTHVSNVLGTINPIKDIISLAHSRGVKVLVDGAQAISHFSVDVRDLDADFYVFSGHKFYGPTGIGILYGKEELLNAMPPYQGGGDMIQTVSFSATTYHPLPLKFEAGTPLIAEVIGLGAAIDYINRLDLSSVQDWEHRLLNAATDQLNKIPGLRIIGTSLKKGGIISFVVEGTHPLDIATLLDLRGIAIRSGHLCAQPLMQRLGLSSAARASFAFYNTMEEIEHFIHSLKEVLKLLA